MVLFPIRVNGGSSFVYLQDIFEILASMRENLPLLYVNNKGADQPVYLYSLISASVIYFLEE